jgi:hypothetical protein
MNKQSEAKISQGYDPKPRAPTCSNCINHKSKDNIWELGQRLIVESNLRCNIGKFAVKETATCKLFSMDEK